MTPLLRLRLCGQEKPTHCERKTKKNSLWLFFFTRLLTAGNEWALKVFCYLSRVQSIVFLIKKKNHLKSPLTGTDFLKNRLIIPTAWPTECFFSRLSPPVGRQQWLCSIYLEQLPCFSLRSHRRCPRLPRPQQLYFTGRRCRCCPLRGLDCKRWRVWRVCSLCAGKVIIWGVTSHPWAKCCIFTSRKVLLSLALLGSGVRGF